ncbi:MAG: response regulator [Deltaproteobacteria bacterium]|nr:response regulator [Deltaproteobacteria bacterium]
MNDENKKTILFVDDEENILSITSEYFQCKGYRVITANNGIEAKKILKEEQIDCCFTDINMPEMNGLELAEHIWVTDNTIPVVIMTAYPSLDNTIKTLQNGVVDFLTKPVNLSQMELCVQRVLSQRQLFIENLLLKEEVEGKARLEKLNKELIYKVDELHTLNKIMNVFSTVGISSDVFRRLVDMTVEIVHADESHFFVINEKMKTLIEVTSSEADKEIKKIEHNDPTEVTEPTIANTNDHSYTETSINKIIMESVSDEMPLLISKNNGTHDLPDAILSFMIVPLVIRDKVFGVLTASIIKGEKRFIENDLYYLTFMAQNAGFAIENLALYENIYENLFATLYAFVNTIEARDPYTRQHSNRVTSISIVIGKELGCTSEELDILNVAGHLHDIGKIGIRDDILLKPGRLTPEEFEKIKEHPVIGANIVKQLVQWDREMEVIRCHHERYDGAGYPDGLKGEEIPFLSRILAVADVYDAIASDRAYRKRMEEKKILKIINEGAGTQFDDEIVKAFLKVYKEGKIKEL